MVIKDVLLRAASRGRELGRRELEIRVLARRRSHALLSLGEAAARLVASGQLDLKEHPELDEPYGRLGDFADRLAVAAPVAAGAGGVPRTSSTRLAGSEGDKIDRKTADALPVRRAESRDLDALSEMMKGLEEVHLRLHPDMFRRVESRWRQREAFERILRSPDDLILVAEDHESAIVAFVHARLFETSRRQPSVVPMKMGHIEAAITIPRMRASGIAGRLVYLADDWAREHGAKEVQTTVWAGNDVAIKSVLTVGFEPLYQTYKLRRRDR